MIETQRKDLTTGLTQRVEVLLNSLDSGSAPYLVLKDKLELANLPDLIKGMDEAKYATITDMDDKVWATNDPDIAGKVVGGDYRQAESVIKDEISPLVPKLSEEINKKAKEYIVKQGESLWEIARKHDCHVSEIKKWNNLSNNKIKPGMKLRIFL